MLCMGIDGILQYTNHHGDVHHVIASSKMASLLILSKVKISR